MLSGSLAKDSIKRERFASLWTVFVFVVGVLVVLALFFPKDDLLEQISFELKPSHLTFSYLNNLLAIYPDSRHLKLLLIEQQIGLGKYQAATDNLKQFRKIKTDNRYFGASAMATISHHPQQNLCDRRR